MNSLVRIFHSSPLTGRPASLGYHPDESHCGNENVLQSIKKNRHKGRKTGPKGVLADHAYYKSIIAHTKENQRQAYSKYVLAKAMTDTALHGDEQAKHAQLLIQQLEKEDEDVLRLYRERRLKELKLLQQNTAHRKQFGTLQEVNATQYANAIDSEWRTVPIVMHIYDNSIDQCRLLNEHITYLARKYTAAKFVRVRARELNFDLVGSPTLLAYRGGVLVANLVRVTESIGEKDFDADAVEDVLLRSGAISEDDILNRSAFYATKFDGNSHH